MMICYVCGELARAAAPLVEGTGGLSRPRRQSGSSCPARAWRCAKPRAFDRMPMWIVRTPMRSCSQRRPRCMTRCRTRGDVLPRQVQSFSTIPSMPRPERRMPTAVAIARGRAGGLGLDHIPRRLPTAGPCHRLRPFILPGSATRGCRRSHQGLEVKTGSQRRGHLCYANAAPPM